MFSALRPLRYRNFALIWAAALLSNVGSWMQTVAVGVFVTARTGRPGWTGLVAAAAFLPIGLLSPVGGAIADRLDRRAWLFLTTVGETLFATALAVLAATGHATPVIVTLLVFGGGAMSAIGFPAYQAMLPSLVPKDELGSAVTLSSAQYNLGRVVGPALAGLAIVAGGYSWAFAINAASFLAVLVALALVRLPPAAQPEGSGSLARRLLEGARATGRNPAARLAVGLISIVAVTASPFIALVPAMALKAFHSKAGGTSVLVTAQGIGAVLGALALTPLANRFGRQAVLLADLVAVTVLLVGYALSPNLWVGAVAMTLVGASYIGVLAGTNTLIQLHAPEAMRGRMLGIYMMALGVLYPIGALVQGAVANVVGIRAVTAGGAIVLLVVTGLGLGRRILASAREDPAREDSVQADPAQSVAETLAVPR
jgi:MFS family permease